MKLHVPHPRRAAEQRRLVRQQRAARVRRAVRQAHLADRTAVYDWEAELEMRRRGRSR